MWLWIYLDAGFSVGMIWLLWGKFGGGVRLDLDLDLDVDAFWVLNNVGRFVV